MLDDINYTDQIALTRYHVSPTEIGDVDYYRFAQIMAAKPREERAVDAFNWLMGQHKKERERHG